MKNLALILAIVVCVPVLGQQSEVRSGKYTMGVQYNHEFVLGGYIRVREWELAGDRMTLKDLGMSSYSAFQLNVSRQLKNNKSLTLAYDRYYMTGSATFDRDIAYNGTLINGRNGIDISPSRYYSVSAIYYGGFRGTPRLALQYMLGIRFDHIVFYLDGEVSTASIRDEVYEGFGRQALPYPIVGLKGKYNVGARGYLTFAVSGTYIPEFKSFYSEGGSVYLQYNNFQTDLSYVRYFDHLEITIGTKSRYIHLFQDSPEDTNLISTFTGGPYLQVAYRF